VARPVFVFIEELLERSGRISRDIYNVPRGVPNEQLFSTPSWSSI